MTASLNLAEFVAFLSKLIFWLKVKVPPLACDVWSLMYSFGCWIKFYWLCSKRQINL